MAKSIQRAALWQWWCCPRACPVIPNWILLPAFAPLCVHVLKYFGITHRPLSPPCRQRPRRPWKSSGCDTKCRHRRWLSSLSALKITQNICKNTKQTRGRCRGAAGGKINSQLYKNNNCGGSATTDKTKSKKNNAAKRERGIHENIYKIFSTSTKWKTRPPQ